MRTAEECLAWLWLHRAMCYPVWNGICVSVSGYEYINAPSLDEAISLMERQMCVIEVHQPVLLTERKEGL